LKYLNKKVGGDEQPIIEIFLKKKNGGDEQPIIAAFQTF